MLERKQNGSDVAACLDLEKRSCQNTFEYRSDDFFLTTWAKVIPTTVGATSKGGKSYIRDDLGHPNVRKELKDDKPGDGRV
jgi:hypothetical protein